MVPLFFVIWEHSGLDFFTFQLVVIILLRKIQPNYNVTNFQLMFKDKQL